MPQLTVAVVGDNTIDRYVSPRGLDYVGGNALNVAVQLAERGFEVYYFGAVGTDREGRRIRDELTTRGVNVDGLATLSGATALTLLSIDEFGDRHMDEEHFGVTADYYPTEAEISWMAGADWVQIGMLPRASELRRALRAVQPALRIGQDCSVTDGYGDLAVAFESSDEEHAHSVAWAALNHGAELAIVTCGPAGATAFEPNGGTIKQPAVPVGAVDTTGAGDSFIAGFVAAYLQSPDLAAAMRSGATWAARTCTHVAGFPQNPAADEHC
jgi:sugar/nucleoside kinase (ribokinase family)